MQDCTIKASFLKTNKETNKKKTTETGILGQLLCMLTFTLIAASVFLLMQIWDDLIFTIVLRVMLLKIKS